MNIPLPKRPPDGHKGIFGRVLVIAGSPGMSGAACLSATAALRSGTGLVTVAVPESIQPVVAAFEPSYTSAALPCESGGQLAEEAVGVAFGLLDGFDAVAVGPGLGQGDPVASLVEMLITCVRVPLVLDADALNMIALKQLSLSRPGPTIVTPHPGEFARLTQRTPSAVNRNRRRFAREFAAQHNVFVVLKGAGTVVSDGVETHLNSTGNSGMATGGSGDILTGMVTALCGQGVTPYHAAISAVHCHGFAADLCAAATSQRGMIASDLLDWLPLAWREFENETH
jgi:ADP-dependent NAD(P)H-hydrate dehydratase